MKLIKQNVFKYNDSCKLLNGIALIEKHRGAQHVKKIDGLFTNCSFLRIIIQKYIFIIFYSLTPLFFYVFHEVWVEHPKNSA